VEERFATTKDTTHTDTLTFWQSPAEDKSYAEAAKAAVLAPYKKLDEEWRARDEAFFRRAKAEMDEEAAESSKDE
jgi:hypothetical protein